MQAPPEIPLPMLFPRNNLKAVNWGHYNYHFNLCFCISWITVLYILTTSVLKTIFLSLSLSFSLSPFSLPPSLSLSLFHTQRVFSWEGKYNSYYSVVAGSKTPNTTSYQLYYKLDTRCTKIIFILPKTPSTQEYCKNGLLIISVFFSQRSPGTHM